jgi:RimK family alpha-L-glutamate ligase
MGLFAVVASRSTPTSARLGVVLTPGQAITRLRAGDVALGRLDVLPSLDGIEGGWWALETLERRGVIVLNDGPSLARAHDKLATAKALDAAGVPHPRTSHVAPWLAWPDAEPPVVLKPRFGSWGRDVVRCETQTALAHAIEDARQRVWFNSTGGVVQELVPPLGYDLRLLVAGGCVVGAVSRHAPPGEWRTNVALGARRVPVVPPPDAEALALAAAEALGGDLVGVDLLPTQDGGWIVLEVNGAADFTAAYSLGEEVFSAARRALSDRAALIAAAAAEPAHSYA